VKTDIMISIYISIHRACIHGTHTYAHIL
jgi:hypothetical protein